MSLPEKENSNKVKSMIVYWRPIDFLLLRRDTSLEFLLLRADYIYIYLLILYKVCMFY
jgi:hypothetical protein